jgi:hypothetical protein
MGDANRGGPGARESQWSVYSCSAALVTSELARVASGVAGAGMAACLGKEWRRQSCREAGGSGGGAGDLLRI